MDNKTAEIAEAREDAPEIVEDEVLKSAHMNYDLVDEEVAKYASETIVEVDEETSKRLKRMIDKRVLVIMMGTYLIQALDKGTMSFASIMGIIPETHLVKTQV
jgi:vacuolar-type H+-ATPase subunit H